MLFDCKFINVHNNPSKILENQLRVVNNCLIVIIKFIISEKKDIINLSVKLTRVLGKCEPLPGPIIWLFKQKKNYCSYDYVICCCTS